MEELNIGALVGLAALWCGYFAAHSLLASLAVKRWVARRWPRLMPGYRLGFNLAALLLLLPPLWQTFALPGAPLWQWRGFWAWLANGLALAALGGFLWSLRYYDSAEFFGLRQWRGRIGTVEDQERFTLSPLHRFVRHPWYSLSLVLVWTRDMSVPVLIGALAITAYLVIGSRLEERKLIAYHGELYRRYRARVPGLVPLPWRWLSRRAAAELLQGTRARS
jgi:protein-S-isoprenylcysteine O-methyltransferase Ste14